MKRLLLFGPLLLLAPSFAYGAGPLYINSNYAWVSSGTQNQNTVTVKTSIPVNSGDLIVVVADNDAGASHENTPTDNQGNTYTHKGSEGAGCSNFDWQDVYTATASNDGVVTTTATSTTSTYNLSILIIVYRNAISVDSATFTSFGSVSVTNPPRQTTTTSVVDSVVAATDTTCGTPGPIGPSGWNLRLAVGENPSVTYLPLAFQDTAVPTAGSVISTWYDYASGNHMLWSIALH